MSQFKRGDVIESTSRISWSMPNPVSYLEGAKITIKPGTQGRIISTGRSSEPYVTFESATVEFDCGAFSIEIPRVPTRSLKIVSSAEAA